MNDFGPGCIPFSVGQKGKDAVKKSDFVVKKLAKNVTLSPSAAYHDLLVVFTFRRAALTLLCLQD